MDAHLNKSLAPDINMLLTAKIYQVSANHSAMNK